MKHDAGTFVRKNGARHESLVLAACREKPAVTVDELTVRLGVSVRTVKRVLASLQEQRRLRRVGGRKFGYWEALP
ncbi:MAG: HTH domain-containing protein [Verrucomicrobiota bacterium]|nr:HTH domain-containing protein [Verrucomicrobiota bacterium]